MNNAWHPDESQLLGYADAELTRTEARIVEQHLDECAECHEQVKEYRRFWPEYRVASRSALPAPPAEWADLRPRLAGLDAEHVRRSRWRPPFQFPMKWVAAAAALTIGAV